MRLLAEKPVLPDVCPRCGVEKPRVYRHDQQEQAFVDTPMHGKRVAVHVMQPWYVGNCHPIRVIIREIVDRTLKPAIDGGDVIVCDLDESVELPE